MSAIFNILVLAIIAHSFVQTGEGVIEENLDLAVTVGAGVTFLVVGYRILLRQDGLRCYLYFRRADE